MSVLRHLMAREPAGPPTRKLTMELSTSAYQRLERLQADTQAKNLTEAIRDALEVREATVKLLKVGCEILIKAPDGTLTSLFLPD